MESSSVDNCNSHSDLIGILFRRIHESSHRLKRWDVRKVPFVETGSESGWDKGHGIGRGLESVHDVIEITGTFY